MANGNQVCAHPAWCGHCGHNPHTEIHCPADGCQCNVYTHHEMFKLFLSVRTVQILERMLEPIPMILPTDDSSIVKP